jgi:hypothetical protein
MSPDLAKGFDEKKFMWDGKTYETEEEARGVMEGYEREGFEVRMVVEENRHLLYTRRVVEEVVVEGPPPI